MQADPLDLLHLLFATARLLRAEAGRRARARGLSRGAFGVLVVLAGAPGITQRELAERLDVEPVTIARLLDRLQAQRLVERRPDPRDRRVWRLHLGPESSGLAAVTAAEVEDLARHLSTSMDPLTRQGLMAGLRHIAAVLTPPDASAHAASPHASTITPAAGSVPVLREVA